jgi:hypothetical protein
MLRTALLTLMLAAPALAQPLPPSTEPAAPAPSAAPAPAASAPAPAPAAPAQAAPVEAVPTTMSMPVDAPSLNSPGMHEFMSHYLTYDESQGQAYEGKGHAPVERVHFYELVGRQDLVEGVHSREFRQRLYYGGAGATLLLGVASGAVLLAAAPDLESQACQAKVDAFQACAARRANMQLAGRALIVGGVVGAGVFSLLALTVDLDPVARSESHRLANEYNGSLRRKLTLGASRETSGRTLTLAPEGGPGQAGVRLALRY